MENKTQTLLKAKNLSINFGGIKAVDNVSFEVNKGEIVSLIGPNGAGKTTVFNLLTGVYKPTAGDILWKNEKIQDLTPQQIVKKGISRTFQNIRLFRDMRVIENVLIGSHIKTAYSLFASTFGLKKFRQEEDQAVANALRILKSLNLAGKKDRYADSLPYGDQRKVEIARAMATGAELLLLDEPAAGMNPQESEELLEFIRMLRDMGYTILLIEHDMSVVMKVSDRVYVLDNGRLIAQGIPETVANDPNVIKAYLGGEALASNQ